MSVRTVAMLNELRKSVVMVLSFPDLARVDSQDLPRALTWTVVRGTAFAVSKDQYLTCNHVVEGLPNLWLLGFSGSRDLPPIRQKVANVQTDRQLDLAIIKTDGVEDLVIPIPFESEIPQVGLDIIAVGYPLPEQRPPDVHEAERRINVNVSATFRAIRGMIASRLIDGLRFEIDKLVNPGQSGGPVIALETGKLVGMCQAYRFLVYKGEATQRMPTDLSVCLSVEVIRSRLAEWGLSLA